MRKAFYYLSLQIDNQIISLHSLQKAFFLHEFDVLSSLLILFLDICGTIYSLFLLLHFSIHLFLE